MALRIDAKKIAAVLALLVALFYTALAGAPVPAQRSCAMAGFALLAILLDRAALSLRLVAWSAVIVLAAAPDSLTPHAKERIESTGIAAHPHRPQRLDQGAEGVPDH